MSMEVSAPLEVAVADCGGGLAVWNLPVELLIEVFGYYLADDARGRPPPHPLLLASVCTLWRTLVLRTPSLWSNASLSATQYTPSPFSSIPGYSLDTIDTSDVYISSKAACDLKFWMDQLVYGGAGTRWSLTLSISPSPASALEGDAPRPCPYPTAGWKAAAHTSLTHVLYTHPSACYLTRLCIRFAAGAYTAPDCPFSYAFHSEGRGGARTPQDPTALFAFAASLPLLETFEVVRPRCTPTSGTKGSGEGPALVDVGSWFPSPASPSASHPPTLPSFSSKATGRRLSQTPFPSLKSLTLTNLPSLAQGSNVAVLPGGLDGYYSEGFSFSVGADGGERGRGRADTLPPNAPLTALQRLESLVVEGAALDKVEWVLRRCAVHSGGGAEGLDGDGWLVNDRLKSAWFLIGEGGGGYGGPREFGGGYGGWPIPPLVMSALTHLTVNDRFLWGCDNDDGCGSGCKCEYDSVHGGRECGCGGPKGVRECRLRTPFDAVFPVLATLTILVGGGHGHDCCSLYGPQRKRGWGGGTWRPGWDRGIVRLFAGIKVLEVVVVDEHWRDGSSRLGHTELLPLHLLERSLLHIPPWNHPDLSLPRPNLSSYKLPPSCLPSRLPQNHPSRPSLNSSNYPPSTYHREQGAGLIGAERAKNIECAGEPPSDYSKHKRRRQSKARGTFERTVGRILDVAKGLVEVRVDAAF